MAFVRTGFEKIMLAIRDQVAQGTGLPATAVKLIGRNPDDVPKLTSDRDILIRPYDFINSGQDQVQWSSAASYLGSYEDASGRLSFHLAREIIVFPRVMMRRDENGRDDLWLTHTDGIFTFETAILSALEDFWPLYANGDNMTTVPVKLIKGTNAGKKLLTEKGVEAEKGTSAFRSSWGHSALSFAVHSLPPIDLTRNTGPFGFLDAPYFQGQQ